MKRNEREDTTPIGWIWIKMEEGDNIKVNNNKTKKKYKKNPKWKKSEKNV